MGLHEVATVALIDSLPKRIRDKIVVVGDCWIWTGCVVKGVSSRQGYGKVYGGVGFEDPYAGQTHRLVYTILVGPIQEGYTLDHLIEEGICTDTRCCNPNHLQQLTVGDNLIKSLSTMPGKHAAKLTCPEGHPYSHTDTVGARRCRICHTANEARRRRRLRDASVPRQASRS